METSTLSGSKPANATAGTSPASGIRKSGDLLTRADYGLHVTGRVDSVGLVQHRSGASAAGKAYSFWQQVISLTLGGEMVEVVYRDDKEPNAPMCLYELDDIVRVKVEKPRIFNGKVSFDAVR